MKFDCNKIDKKLIGLYVFFSGFVYFEPGLPEYLFLLFIIYSLVFCKLTMKEKYLYFFLLLISLYMISFLININNIDIRFILIDVYLILVLLLFIPKIVSLNVTLEDIMPYWNWSGLINILVCYTALVAGTNQILGIEVLKYGARFSGFFKDANVFGPFVIVPAIYFLSKSLEEIKVKYVVLFLFYTSGVLFSFSRAAWLNYIITLILMLVFSHSRKKFKLILYIAVSVFCLTSVLLKIDRYESQWELVELFTSRLGLQSYDDERFESHRNVIVMIENSPLMGVGPGNYIQHSNIEAHQTFLRLLGERGLIGGLLAIFFIIYPLFNPKISSLSNMLLFSILSGLLVNSLFIDTLHWRHLWIILVISYAKISTKTLRKLCKTTGTIRCKQITPEGVKT